MKRALAIAVAAATIIGGLFTALAYFKEGSPSSVRADGGFAAGRDLKVEGDVRVNQFDFEEQARQQAERYVTVARQSCAGLAQRTEALTAESSLNPQAVAQFSPQELYPQQEVADHFGEAAYGTVNARLAQIDANTRPVMRVLTQNLVTSMVGQSERREKRTQQQRADFSADKQRLLASIIDLCGYLATLKR